MQSCAVHIRDSKTFMVQEIWKHLFRSYAVIRMKKKTSAFYFRYFLMRFLFYLIFKKWNETIKATFFCYFIWFLFLEINVEFFSHFFSFGVAVRLELLKIPHERKEGAEETRSETKRFTYFGFFV